MIAFWTEELAPAAARQLTTEIEELPANPARSEVAMRGGRAVPGYPVTPLITALVVDGGGIYLGFPDAWAVAQVRRIVPGIVLTRELPAGVPGGG